MFSLGFYIVFWKGCEGRYLEVLLVVVVFENSKHLFITLTNPKYFHHQGIYIWLTGFLVSQEWTYLSTSRTSG